MPVLVPISDQHFTMIDFTLEERTLDAIFSQWAADVVNPTPYTAIGGDDGISLIDAPALWPGGRDSLSVAYEGGIEVTPLYFGAGTSFTANLASNGINRYQSMDTGRRVALIYHPTGLDSGLSEFSGIRNSVVGLFRGSYNRTGEGVKFVARAVAGKRVEVAVDNTAAAAGVTVKAVVFAGTSVVSVADVGTIPRGQRYLIQMTTRGGAVSGTVVDQAGAPAARRVVIHERETGSVVGRGMSGTDGRYSIDVSLLPGKVMYVIALDDEVAPLTNAVIADRVVLQ
ncbi:TPA: hypothetical protein UN285_000424 [Stenotrophomonas maltophilia]|jgi:hypothetical protein|nr:MULTISPECIES: hypothetical protein [Stenotrophomonas]EED38166.1 conserved hypothetical protein [Stenotrophomonas sp. SKA14]MBS6054040.1 hypothetical protein [Stenotrophomonas maltophilia]MDG9766167.1 hypothetical protein [Stenotrophomonas maltophilia]MDG9908431.1 hypothetical protein [Stenotrophomonas maltophilia]MDH0538669.1 hypothetical protein [Stenotrophomonas maltophilia]